jgi:hypothetical protein
VLSPLRSAALAGVVVALTAGIGGCAKFDQALGQQWIVVSFAPNTSLATARHVASVCSHVPNMPLEGKVKPDTGQPGVVDEVDFNAVNATDAEMAQLEQCVSRFRKVVDGFTEQDQGDS